MNSDFRSNYLVLTRIGDVCVQFTTNKTKNSFPLKPKAAFK